MLGVLAGVGKTLLGELFSKGVSTLGNVARKALDTYVPQQNQEYQGDPSKSMGKEYQGSDIISSQQEFEGDPNLPSRQISAQHKVFGQRLTSLESGVEKLRKRLRK